MIGALQGEPVVRVTTTTAPPSTTTTVVALAPLGEVGEELDELAAAGRLSDFHAVYGVEDPKLPEGLIQTVEVWRKGDKFRSDIIERAANGTRRQTALYDGRTRRSCETVAGTQTCKVTEVDPVDLLVAFIRAVDAKDPDPKLTAHDEVDIAGYQARCFEARRRRRGVRHHRRRPAPGGAPGRQDHRDAARGRGAGVGLRRGRLRLGQSSSTR